MTKAIIEIAKPLGSPCTTTHRRKNGHASLKDMKLI